MSELGEHIRARAVEELRTYGIEGPEIYLIDVIPLIEMIWADGRTQPKELDVLDEFLIQHVEHINRMGRHEILTIEAARTFVSEFLVTRPDPELLRALRELIAPARMSGADESALLALKESLLAACLDIAASSVAQDLRGVGERFSQEEKRCFFELLETL